MPTQWTPEMTGRLTQLCQMPDAGTFTEIAAVLEQEFAGELFSKNSCIGQAHRLKISNGRPPGLRAEARLAARKPGKPRRRRAFKERAAPTPPPPPRRPKPGTVKLLDLRYSDCHWPYGDGPYLFCGDAACDGSRYCAEHDALAYQRPRR